MITALGWEFNRSRSTPLNQKLQVILQVKLPRRMRLRMSWRTPPDPRNDPELGFIQVGLTISTIGRTNGAVARDSTEIHKNAETFAEKTKVLADV